MQGPKYAVKPEGKTAANHKTTYLKTIIEDVFSMVVR
jgi:hypothetical protein